jgi:hypothetical protein
LLNFKILFFYIHYVRFSKTNMNMRICVLLQVSLFLFLGSLKAQTTLIDPAGAGGFALGNTFQSNGWTVSNFENVNGWAIGNSFDANKSAFASPNWEDATPLPGIDVSDLGKSFHFYRDITLPANETVVELSFRFRMDRGYFTVGVATTDYVPGITNLQVPTSMGNTLYQANFFSTSQTPNWFPVSRYVPASFAGTTIRLVFTGYYAPTLSPPAQAQGPAVIDISLTSRAATAFESVPGTFAWTNPDAWLPKGIPVAGDDATITAGSTITGGPGSSVNNLTVAGSLTSNIGVVTGDLVVTNTGRYVPQITNLSINGHFTVQQGGFVDARLPSIIFSRSLEVPALQQVFSFHSPQQFEGATIRALVISNAEGMRVQAAGGRLAVCSLVNIATGTLVTNDALELNHQTIANIPYTAISFNGSSTWSAPIPRAADARVGLLYNGSQGTPENPYILGTRGEWAANDTLYEFTLGNISSHIKSPDDLKVAATIGSRFRLFGVLQMEAGKSVIITESAFPGTTPQGFPGPATTNIFNNAHVAGGGVVFRLNGTNLNRVWPVGVDGQQFVLGMYGINATNALVRVEALKSEEGTAGAALNTINPLYRYKVEVLEGTIKKSGFGEPWF